MPSWAGSSRTPRRTSASGQIRLGVCIGGMSARSASGECCDGPCGPRGGVLAGTPLRTGGLRGPGLECAFRMERRASDVESAHISQGNSPPAGRWRGGELARAAVCGLTRPPHQHVLDGGPAGRSAAQAPRGAARVRVPIQESSRASGRGTRGSLSLACIRTRMLSVPC